MGDGEAQELHITIQRGTAFPLMEKCMTCCPPGTYHCPFCSPAFFKPAKRSKVMVHLEFHLKKACQLGGYTIHRCGLDCAKRPHYHCLYCIAMLGGKLDFYRHVEFCKKMQKRTDNPQDETLLTNRARADPEKDMSSYFMGPNESESEDVTMDAQSKTEGEGSSSSKSDILLVWRPSDGNAAVKEVPPVTKQHKMLQVNLDKPQDCDEFYFMNLAKMFKKLAPSKKTDVRMKIERVLFEAEFM